MVSSDARWFFALVSELKELRGLLVAGSTLKVNSRGNISAEYLDMTIREAAPNFGYALRDTQILSGSGTARRHLLLTPEGIEIPVFFFGSSPSSRTPQALVSSVRDHAISMKEVAVKIMSDYG